MQITPTDSPGSPQTPSSEMRKSKSLDSLLCQSMPNIRLRPAPGRASRQSAVVAIPTLSNSLQGLSLQPQKPLDVLINKIIKNKGLETCDNLRQELSIDGKNVLHYIAGEPNFSLYEVSMKKLLSLPQFHQLLTQECAEEGETPLHVIVQTRNVAMLKCLLAAPNANIREYLQFAGSVVAKNTERSVFHYLGYVQDNKKLDKVMRLFCGTISKSIPRSYLNKYAIHPQLLEMMDLLVELYGPLESKNLASKADSRGFTLLTLSCMSGNYAFIQKTLELFRPQQEMRDSSKSPRAKRVEQEALGILLPKTQVTPLHILAAIGRPSCLQLVLTHYGAVAKEVCKLSSSHFKARSALEMCSVTSCSTQEEKHDFVESCRLVLKHLAADFEPVDSLIAHKSPDAQFVCRTLRTAHTPIDDPAQIEEYAAALYQSYQSEKQADASKD